MNNPYTVANMTAAWNELYGTSYVALPRTHLYVRFLPASLEELEALYELEDIYDIDFEDYPLDYEIVREGNFYHDSSLPEDKPTWLYTAVPDGFLFPNIQYEILDELVLAPYTSHLTTRAFIRTGNEYEYDWGGSSFTCNEACPSYPCCLENTSISCNSPCSEPCLPGSANWPECLRIDPVPDDYPPGYFNECGCPKPTNSKFAAGCIQVVDTQIDPEPGVRHVRVVVRKWFGAWKTDTDDAGCFIIPREFHGKIKVKVKFQSGRCKIRAIRKLVNVWQYGAILKDVQLEYGPTFNDIHILYVQDDDLESLTRAHWYAATGNNALHEFDGFANSDGIASPPKNLQILLTPVDEGAATPMFDKMSVNPVVSIGFVHGMVGLAATLGMVADPSGPITGTFLTTVMGVLSLYLVVYAPDVVYNHGADFDPGDDASDQVKETFYHEYAHAAHFNALNNHNYWLANAGYVAQNNGYGDGTATGAQRCAIIEMWGFHYGPVCADYQYGASHSNTTSNDPGTIQETRHIYELEGFAPAAPPNNNNRWIPQGLFWDCVDNNATNPGGVTDGVAPDIVSGFSHADFFRTISNSSNQVSTVRDNLTTLFLPPGQTTVGVNGLFSLYGF